MQSGNPVLSQDIFRIEQPTAAASATMTINGTVTKTAILLAVAVAAGAVSWVQITRSPETMMPFVLGGAIGGLILGIVISFKPNWSPALAPVYALCEGVFLGAFSLYADQYVRSIAGASAGGAIVPQAMILTLGTLASMLIAYRAGLIRATEKFKAGMFAALGGIALVAVGTMILSLCGVDVSIIRGNGVIAIGFTVVVLIVAALSLILDFDLIESGVKQGAAKYMEWYGAFALMVTLVWLYIRFLRLLMQLQRRD